MFKRELKINLKSFIIWTSILILLFLVVFLVYPSIVSSDNINQIDEMMKLFPEEVLRAFNMDISSMDSAYGWLKSEGFIMILLVTGIYSSILGSTIILKEESDKTIEYLNSLPLRRKDILRDKVLVGIIYIILMVLVIAIFNYIALYLSGDFDKKQYLLLSITPLLTSLPLFSINLYISTYFNKLKSIFGISLGVSIGSYFIQILADMSEKVEFLKYLSIYTLADIRNIIIDIRINPIMIIVSILITLVFIVSSYLKYNKKELL